MLLHRAYSSVFCTTAATKHLFTVLNSLQHTACRSLASCRKRVSCRWCASFAVKFSRSQPTFQVSTAQGNFSCCTMVSKGIALKIRHGGRHELGTCVGEQVLQGRAAAGKLNDDFRKAWTLQRFCQDTTHSSPSHASAESIANDWCQCLVVFRSQRDPLSQQRQI